jgi:hypothetical protein
MSLPNYSADLLPAGVYTAEVEAEAVEKESRFDSAKTYFEIRLTLRDAKNVSHDYRWRFQPRGPVYRDFLIAVGGKAGPDGSVAAPGDYLGKTFRLTLAKRASKTDPSKMLNEVIGIEGLEAKYSGPDEDVPF